MSARAHACLGCCEGMSSAFVVFVVVGGGGRIVRMKDVKWTYIPLKTVFFCYEVY